MVFLIFILEFLIHETRKKLNFSKVWSRIKYYIKLINMAVREWNFCGFVNFCARPECTTHCVKGLYYLYILKKFYFLRYGLW